MPVQVAALAFVVRDAVTSVKLEAAGDKHDKLGKKQGPIISLDNFRLFMPQSQEIVRHA